MVVPQARRPESVAVAPSNVAVMRGHLPCAAAERPLESEDGRPVMESHFHGTNSAQVVPRTSPPQSHENIMRVWGFRIIPISFHEGRPAVMQLIRRSAESREVLAFRRCRGCLVRSLAVPRRHHFFQSEVSWENMSPMFEVHMRYGYTNIPLYMFMAKNTGSLALNRPHLGPRLDETPRKCLSGGTLEQRRDDGETSYVPAKFWGLRRGPHKAISIRAVEEIF